MKTIEVTDEIYSSLMELSKEILTQDNRCTAMPYLFQIRTREETPVYPGGDGRIYWVNDEGDQLDELDELDEIKRTVLEIFDETDKYEALKCESYDSIDVYEITSILEENGWEQIVVKEEEIYQNAFFTAKACDEHIRLNSHRYRKPDCYLSHATRNPEMELMQRFLCELSGGEYRR